MPPAKTEPKPAQARPADAGVAPAGVLDAQALANLRQLDPNGTNRLLPRVLSTYRASLAKLMSQMSDARGQSDLARLRLAVHTLKSSSASVGALALSVLCGDAEKALRDGELNKLPPLLDQLAVEAGLIDAAVLQLLSDK